MDIAYQLALIIVPAGAVLITAVFFMNKMVEKEARASHRDLQRELKGERQKFFLPHRVDAYQRAILLMERIHPNSLLMRNNNPGLPAAAMQIKLMEEIRHEYEHNIAQQMFIKSESWEMVSKAKDETVKIIGLAGQQMEPTSTAMDLASKIFKLVAEIGTLPSEIAVQALRRDVQDLF